MFTGIVEEVGTVESVRRGARAARLTVRAKTVLEGTRVGDSIAVDGCCLTVASIGDGAFAADLSAETLERTTIGSRAPGDAVNLERAVRLDGRLGGHIVTGHVDGVGTIAALAIGTEQAILTVELPDELLPFVAEKGSIAIDGISLTVANLEGRRCSVALIPHTIERTSLRARRVGDRVNVEVDIIARYVARQLAEASRRSTAEASILDFLKGGE